MTIQIRYFASLREHCGRSEELRGTAAGTPAPLLQRLRHDIVSALDAARLRQRADFRAAAHRDRVTSGSSQCIRCSSRAALQAGGARGCRTPCRPFCTETGHPA